MKKSHASIKKKIIRSLTIFFIGVGIIISFLINNVYLRSLEKLELLSVENSVGVFMNEIDYGFNNLSTISKDWAIWDDTYLFAQGLDERYVETNLADGNFDLYDADLIMFVDNLGKILYGKQRDFETEEVKEIDSVVSNILFGLDIFKNKNPETVLSALIIIDRKPMLMVSHPILKTDKSGPVMGNVVFGRVMDLNMMEEISDKLGLKTSFKWIENGSPDLATKANDRSIEVDVLDSEYITGSFYLPVFNNQGYIQMSTEIPRQVMEIGRKSVGFLLLLLPIIIMVTLLLLIYVLDKLVLSRVTNLNKQVIEIKEKKTASDRVDVEDSHDEISQLSRSINQMLSGLEELQFEIAEANNTLEIKIVERTKELEISNQRLEVEIVERQKIQDEITFLAYHDTLTGLPNRLLFTDRVNQGIIRANRHEIPMSVMFIDLDGFKIINDTLGHNAGDDLLIQVSSRLTRIVRKNDTVCRIGGDEFVLFINGYKEDDNVDMIALKVMDSFKTPFIINDQEYYITASMGIAQYPIDGEDVETLMKTADMVMYEAKALGKNQYQKCSTFMKESAIETMSLTNNLHRAVERGEMMLYYQPQVNGLTGEIEGVEALLRWNHPEFGFVPPMKFIPLAEKTRLILPIGNWVLKTACEQCKNWQDKGLKHVRMAVNFSIHQLNDPKVVEQIADILTELSLQPSYLEIELTESIAMNRNGVVKETLEELKTLGVTLSIDDFGTEYSSLSRLKDLPIDRLKIDMSFVQGIGISDKDEAITKTVILLANTLGLTTIAEGVETKDQLDFLNARMCDEVQGYYMHKPMPAEDMEKLLRKSSNLTG